MTDVTVWQDTIVEQQKNIMTKGTLIMLVEDDYGLIKYPLQQHNTPVIMSHISRKVF